MTDRARERARGSAPREAVSFRLAPEHSAAVDRLVSAKVFLTRAHFYEEAVIELLKRYPSIAYRVEGEADDDAA